MLQPQDVLVALKLYLLDDPALSFENLATRTGLSASGLHRSVGRLIESGLLTHSRTVRVGALLEFILHGVRYAYPARPGEPVRGTPTAYAAPPLVQQLRSSDLPPVWPDPLGTVRGRAVEPLHGAALIASSQDPELYELLALVDTIRIGHARERNLATEELQRRLVPRRLPGLEHA
jgi:DNA-binding Lrp family transcriptional regulator